MKTLRLSGMLFSILLLALAACSQFRELTPADRRYILLPNDLSPDPFGGFVQEKAWGNVDYLLFTKRYSSGFRGLYGTILKAADGRKVDFLCLIHVLPTPGDARDLYENMTPEGQPLEYGREVTVPPHLYGADAVYCYIADTGYLHMVVHAARVVYAVLVDGTVVSEPQLRRALRAKLEFIRGHEDLFG